MTAPSSSGVDERPDEVAEVPDTPCTKSGTDLIALKTALPTRAMSDADGNDRVAGSRKGRIGSRERRSTNAKCAAVEARAASASTTARAGYTRTACANTSSEAAEGPFRMTSGPRRARRWCLPPGR